MKSSRSSLARDLDQPNAGIRFYLFYGPGEGQSRALAERLLKGLGAEKFVVPAQAIKADPAALADEAAAIGLFGGKRALWIEPAGEEITAGVESLLAAPAAESPAIAVAGVLRKTSSLARLAESHASAFAHVSYEPSERDAIEIVESLAKSEGLRLGPGIGSRIAGAAGNDRGIIAQELAKIALYLGATPDNPARVEADALGAIGAGAEGDRTRLVDLALTGNVDELARELEIGGSDSEPIPVLRALQRRILLLAPIRSRVEQGQRPHDAVTSAGKSVFWREKETVTRIVAIWDSQSLSRVLDRSADLERRLMRPDSPPPFEALEEELVAVARTARRRT